MNRYKATIIHNKKITKTFNNFNNAINFLNSFHPNTPKKLQLIKNNNFIDITDLLNTL